MKKSTKTMYYREDTNTKEKIEALSLEQLFNYSNKISFQGGIGVSVEQGKTATDKAISSGFLTRTSFENYFFGSLGIANAIFATAIISAVRGGVNVITSATANIIVNSVKHLPQAEYYHCTATAINIYSGVKHTINFCLTASYNDITAQKKAVNDRVFNTKSGYIPLNKTENQFKIDFIDNVYIGDFDAFSFNIEQ